MKRIILAAIVALMSVNMAGAEEPVLGVRASLDINSLTGEGFKNACGYSLGAVYRMPMTINGVQGLYLEPGVTVYKDRWGVDAKNIINPDLMGRYTSQFFSTWGFRIPVTVGWGYNLDKDWKLLAYTGPEMSLGVGNKLHANGRTDQIEVNTTMGAYGNSAFVHRFDLAWKFGIGAEYQAFHFDIGGAIGMTHVFASGFPEQLGNSYLNRVTLTLGYNFSL